MKKPIKTKKQFHQAANTGSSYTSDFSTFLDVTFHSPYIDTDYQLFEGIWQNTLVGTAMDTRVSYAIGRGLKPTFYLRDKSIKDTNQKKAKLEKYDEVISELMRLDDNERFDMSTMAEDLLRNTHCYGRSVLAFEYDDSKTLYSLKPIHARDLGRLFVTQSDWKVSSVYAFQKSQLINAEDMIYLCQFPFSPIRRGYWYGFSSVQRVLGQARSIRAINEFDIPEVAQALWAKYGTFVVNQDGMTEAEKIQDLNTLKRNIKPGGYSFLTGSGNKDDIQFFAADTEPKVAELATIKDSVDRDILGNFQVPGGMFGREADQTRATMLGKIRLFVSGPVESDRRMLGKPIAKQWYERNIIAMGKGDILKEVGVEVTFEPIILENWMDVIDSVATLKNVFPGIPEDELLRIANLEDLIGKLTKENVLKPEGAAIIKEKTNNSELANKMRNIVEK